MFIGRRYTYRQFYERINRLASALKGLGVKYGDKVAFISPNIPPMLEAHFAVPLIGAALVSVNIRLSAPEVAYILNHSDTSVCFVDNEFADLVLPVLDEIIGVRTYINICDADRSCPLDGMDYERFLETGSSADVPMDIEDEIDVATINYTSGTTGIRR